jgi:hypothetical protein
MCHRTRTSGVWDCRPPMDMDITHVREEQVQFLAHLRKEINFFFGLVKQYFVLKCTIAEPEAHLLMLYVHRHQNYLTSQASLKQHYT